MESQFSIDTELLYHLQSELGQMHLRSALLKTSISAGGTGSASVFGLTSNPYSTQALAEPVAPYHVFHYFRMAGGRRVNAPAACMSAQFPSKGQLCRRAFLSLPFWQPSALSGKLSAMEHYVVRPAA